MVGGKAKRKEGGETWVMIRCAREEREERVGGEEEECCLGLTRACHQECAWR